MSPEEVPTGRNTVCVLVAVDSYEHPPFEPIRGGKARHNVDALKRVLRGHGRRSRRTVAVHSLVNPGHPDDIRLLLREFEREPPALLVFYYMGHGYLDPKDEYERDKLYLATSGSSAANIAHSAYAFRDLALHLQHIGADRTAVILDCCFSGNFPTDVRPEDKHFSVLAAAPKGFLISPGPPEEPMTPFTAQLVRALEEEPRGMGELGVRLRELAAEPDNRPVTPYMPWSPVEISAGDGGRTVLVPYEEEGEDGPHPEPGPPAPDPAQRQHPGLRPGVAARRLRAALWAALDRRPGRRLPPRRQAMALALVLLLPVGAAVAVVAANGGGGAEPCPVPLELRMATAPEEVEPMRDLVRKFEGSPQNRPDGPACRAARFTVYAASLDALTKGFGDAKRWGSSGTLTEVGPQPDVWVAQSSAAVSQVRSALVPPPGGARDGSPARLRHDQFFRPSTLMNDQPVLVVTGKARERLSLPSARDEPGRTDWKSLRAALRRLDAAERPALLRPNPTVSDVGLAHTLGMYAASGTGEFGTDSGLLPDSEVEWLETEVISQGQSIAASAQALCTLSGDAAAGALVSGRQAELFVREPDHYCTEKEAEVDVHRYVVGGGPPLDHQLVEIAWPADDRTERADAIGRFGDWARTEDGRKAIGEARHTPPGSYLFELSDKDVGDRMDRFQAAHPPVRVSVLFDVTRSMLENGRFPAARRAVEESLGRLGESDRYRVTVFPTGKDGSGTDAVADWTAVPEDGGVTLPVSPSLPEANGRQADLYGTLRKTADAVAEEDAGRTPGAARHVIVLVTDGDYVKGRTPRVRALEDVAGELGQRDVPVIVASMRPYGCAAGRDTGVIAAESGGECESSGDLAAELPRHVAALTEGRRTG
ncbi:hypothetical protein DVA86_14650 [Streptomyces armeniacus]|uniref:VWFA domain-containing protein n=1 Tax=Streptomyces armeniacus TaxID=83291 RepID=A0A345XPZ4_9ACTN|nr:hypothetical protein [Streptomyces armeniacus]AXK33710.1 hypothetical protein DVA86_14650 [Streptomyces armeniacus]